ncbi:MAG: permease [Bellilinea sp.]
MPSASKYHASSSTTGGRLPLLVIAAVALAGILSRILESSGGNATWMTAFLDSAHRFSVGFERIFLETAPFLLLGAFTSAVVAHLFTDADIQTLFKGGTLGSVIFGILAAVILPVGDGGSALVARQLLRKGAGVPAAAALMAAGPGVTLIATGAGLGATGMAGLAGLRFATAVILAIVFGLILAQESEPKRIIKVGNLPTVGGDSASLLEGEGQVSKAKAIVLTASIEFLEWMPLLVIAALLGGLLQALIPGGWNPPVSGSGVWQNAGSGLWAMLTAQSAVGDLHTVQNGLSSWSAGAQRIYLLVGMAVDVKLILFYGRIFRFKVLLYWILLSLSLSLMAGLVIESFGGLS